MENELLFQWYNEGREAGSYWMLVIEDLLTFNQSPVFFKKEEDVVVRAREYETVAEPAQIKVEALYCLDQTFEQLVASDGWNVPA